MKKSFYMFSLIAAFISTNIYSKENILCKLTEETFANFNESKTVDLVNVVIDIDQIKTRELNKDFKYADLSYLRLRLNHGTGEFFMGEVDKEKVGIILNFTEKMIRSLDQFEKFEVSREVSDSVVRAISCTNLKDADKIEE